MGGQVETVPFGALTPSRTVSAFRFSRTLLSVGPNPCRALLGEPGLSAPTSTDGTLRHVPEGSTWLISARGLTPKPANTQSCTTSYVTASNRTGMPTTIACGEPIGGGSDERT